MPRPSVVAQILLVGLLAPPCPAPGQAAAAGHDAARPDDRTQEADRPGTPPAHGGMGVSHTLGDDLRHLASRDAAFVLGAGAALSLLAASEDRDLSRRLSASAAGDRIFEAGDILGGAWVQAGGTFAAYAVGKLARKPALAHLGVDLMRAQALNGLLTVTLKRAVRRTRPDGGRHSFPSGHASASFASATVLGRRLGAKAAWPAFVVASYVAVSRVQEKRHFPSDVVFGAALGIVAGRAVTAAHGGRRVALEPILGVDGGAGLALAVAWGPGRR